MLTALDFPEELLYADAAMWLRDDGGGSARVGLHFFAIDRDAAEVVHVRLPVSGAKLVRGEPFGHVDFGDGTVDLIAPVTGQVLCANPDLRDEPQLLRRDPFGKGYLLDVENIDKAELDALLGRDDAWARYGRFEPPGPLRAEMKVEAGRPWWSTFAARYGDKVIARARLVPALANEIFVPDWEVGDTWRIETKVGPLARRFVYRVEGPTRLAGEEATRVRVIEEPEEGRPAPQFERVLYFREDDFTLAAWDRVPAADRSVAFRTWNERGHDVWIRCGKEDGFILDHPTLPMGVEDDTRDVPAGMMREAVASSDDDPQKNLLPKITMYSKFRGGLTRLEAEMRADLPRLEGGTERLLSTQVWEVGKPWWSEATRMLDEKELIRAKML